MNLPTTRNYLFIILLTAGFFYHSRAQTNPNFNVSLQFDYTSAEQAILLYQGQFVNTKSVAGLRGNSIAASTTSLIDKRSSVDMILTDYLDSLKNHQRILHDIYQLEEAKASVAEIQKLYDEMKKRNFARRIVATVEQIFPPDASITTMIPVYVVALGHENVDAYVRRILWDESTPRFVGGEKGELTIVINLAHAVHFGRTVDDQLLSILGVVAHEVFHAAFGTYKETSPRWKRYYASHATALDELLDLTHNEGIAYYLSLDQQGRGYLPEGWNERMTDVFKTFNSKANDLLSPNLTPRQADEIIRGANLSGYWESYGSMTGMFIARSIDKELGRKALIETIAYGPGDFFKKYLSICKKNGSMLKLSNELIQKIN